MKNSIKEFVQSCTVCQQAKPERVNYLGLLSPLPVAKKDWETVTMDFISGLPSPDQLDWIMVVIEKFTKYGHFIPIKHHYNAMKFVELFFDNVYKLHGMPLYIVSGGDLVFTSKFWQILIKRTSTLLNMSTAYHPETDSQTKRVNQQVECYLRCLISARPRKWNK